MGQQQSSFRRVPSRLDLQFGIVPSASGGPRVPESVRPVFLASTMQPLKIEVSLYPLALSTISVTEVTAIAMQALVAMTGTHTYPDKTTGPWCITTPETFARNIYSVQHVVEARSKVVEETAESEEHLKGKLHETYVTVLFAAPEARISKILARLTQCALRKFSGTPVSLNLQDAFPEDAAHKLVRAHVNWTMDDSVLFDVGDVRKASSLARQAGAVAGRGKRRRRVAGAGGEEEAGEEEEEEEGKGGGGPPHPPASPRSLTERLGVGSVGKLLRDPKALLAKVQPAMSMLNMLMASSGYGSSSDEDEDDYDSDEDGGGGGGSKMSKMKSMMTLLQTAANAQQT